MRTWVRVRVRVTMRTWSEAGVVIRHRWHASLAKAGVLGLLLGLGLGLGLGLRFGFGVRV
jgi:hypothetical protein